jgi:hypothetical protein
MFLSTYYNLIIPSQLLSHLSFDLLLTTIYSQHGFKSWTLRNAASRGYDKIIYNFKLISAHVVKFCMSVIPFSILALICLITFSLKIKRPPSFQLLSNSFAVSVVGQQPAAATCWILSKDPWYPFNVL